jgi:hypothetical protein
MAILRRLNPRQLRGSAAQQLTIRWTASASAGVFVSELFGNAGPIATGQGSATTDFTATVSSPSNVFLTGQGSETTDAVFNIVSYATIDTGQGSSTTDASFAVPFWASVDTGQGSATSDAVFGLVDFHNIQPTGWLDSAIVTTQPGQSFWGANPRTLSTSLVTQIVQNPVAADEMFTPHPYNVYADGFGSPSATYGSQRVTDAGAINEEAFGTASVDLSTQYIALSGMSDEAFGTPTIYLSQQYVSLSGFTSYAFGTLTIGNVTFTQYVFPSGIAQGSVGSHALIGPSYIFAQRIDPVGFGTQVIYNKNQYKNIQGFNSAAYGTPEVVGPRLVRPSGTSMSLYGTSARVEHAVRNVYPSWTIGSIPGIGRPTVTDSSRVIYVDGSDYGAMGEPIVAMPPFDIVWVDSTADSNEDFGTPNVGIGPRAGTIYPPSLVVPPLGTPSVSPFYIAPSGIDATRWGAPWVSNWIRTVGTSGFVATRWGVQWVSNWIRYVYPDGYDVSLVWNEFGPINTDGTYPGVYNATGGSQLPGTVGPYGMGPQTFGHPTVDLGTHYAAPTSFDLSAVGVPTILTVKRILVDGFDDTVFGDVQKWENGKIKPQGQDLCQFGIPRMGIQITQTGYVHIGAPRPGGVERYTESGPVFGYPKVNMSVVVGDGMNTFGMGTPTTSYADGGEFVCSLGTHAIPIAGFSDAGFGSAIVSN